MVDPSRCPIPPGFEVIDGFSDDFDHFKEFTGYADSWQGYSHRWKNDNLETSVNIVVGFQFKIGPSGGPRWRDQFSVDREIKDWQSGDVNLHFPRTDEVTVDRGGYFVSIKWDPDPLSTFASLGKEIPHGTYSEGNFFDTHKFRDISNSIILPPVRDGQWHSFLAVIYNDWYDPPNGPLSEYPTIGLWYSHTPSFRFEDFEFLGMAIDFGDMPPRGPLRRPVLSNDIFKIEHTLQIRIDDVPTEQVKIQNVYAASVRFHGAIPPPNPVKCISEARAVNDVQVEVDRLEKEKKILSMDLEDLTGRALDARLNEIQAIDNILHRKYSVLSTAKFMYGECANIGFRRRVILSLRGWLMLKALDGSQGIRSIMSSFSDSNLTIGQLIRHS
jgi:hypothetical protein